MILFFAKEIGGNHGNPTANLDLVISLLITNRKVGIVYFSKVNIPESVNGKKIHPLLIDHKFKAWPPTKKDQDDLTGLIASIDLEVVISSDYAFHNFIKFKILNNSKNRLIVKTVVISHTQPKNYNFSVPIEEIINRANEYDHFVSVSKNVLKEWKDHGLKTVDSQCHHIPNCCNELGLPELTNLDKLEVRDRLKLPHHCFISVCVATIQNRKNQQLIINNAHSLLENFPNDLFLFVGAITNMGGTKIAEQIYNSKYKENFKLVGEVDDARPYIKAADMLILPSLAEVLPISILEAMAVRTPVLASDVGGVSEMIKHNENGFYFNVSNNKEFLEFYSRLRKDETLRQEFTESSYKKYLSKFSRKCHEKLWNKLLQGICTN